MKRFIKLSSELSSEHSTTCDSRTHLNHMKGFILIFIVFLKEYFRKKDSTVFPNHVIRNTVVGWDHRVKAGSFDYQHTNDKL